MAILLNRRGMLIGSTATGAALSFGPAFAQAPTQVGFVYLGPPGDHGWTYAHDQARKAVEAKFGARVKVNVVENVKEGPDSERVIRQLATNGNNIIFTTSFGYMQPTLRVAQAFPKVFFEHCSGYLTGPNTSNYNARYYEGRAVCGTIAALTSKTGTAGYIASFPIPEVVMGINAFTLAARKIRPDFKVRVIWVSSWFDPGKEADAAKTLLDQGADVLCQHTDSPAAMQTAEQRGAFAFGQASDMRAFGPKAQLTAIVHNWADYSISRIEAAMNGTWKTSSVWLGMKDGMVKMADYGPGVSAEARAAADKLKADIISGAAHPFTGPIKDQKGVERLAAGQKFTDEQMSKMDWYVEGVQS
jgi:basic membrane protein A and related proteins